MSGARDIACLPAVTLQRLLQRGELSPLEVMEACLAQVSEHNPTINAICTLNERAIDTARELTEKSPKGDQRGLLYGLPVGIKDVTPTAGLRTTYGSTLYRDHVPDEDALVVRRLKAAGAIILGKTNTPEFATGGNTFNEVFGLTRNPWNVQKSAGGSTGGGAAGLATGMIAFAEGTDLGGSLRIPASFCGITGLRPSPGLVPTWPSAYVWDAMQVTGIMGRTAADIALALQAISGPSRWSPVFQPAAGRDFAGAVASGIGKKLRIAYCADIAGIGVEDDIEAICRNAANSLRDAGAQVDEIALDLSFAWQPFLAIRGFWMVAQQYRHLDSIDQFGENLSGNIRAGLKVSMSELAAAEAARGRVWHLFRELFERYDYLLTPCMAVPPFPAEQNYPPTIGGKEMATYIDWVAPTFLLSLAGLPVASVPCGLDGQRLPVGVQVAGPPFGEEKVLALAQHLQDGHAIGLPV